MIFGVVADACTSMCFQPKLSCSGEAIKLVTFPPCAFIHASVDLAMVPAAQWHRELVTDLASESARLGKAQVSEKFRFLRRHRPCC